LQGESDANRLGGCATVRKYSGETARIKAARRMEKRDEQVCNEW
jgi:hypothetical protein